MNSGKIFHLKTEREFDIEVINSPNPVIIDFYADWCGPCKKLAPELENLCNLQKSFKLVKINVDEADELSSNYKVTSIPLVILFNLGKEISRFSGYDTAALANMIAKCKTLNKNAGWEGRGIAIDSSLDNKASTASWDQINALKSNIPSEPAEGTSGVFTIVFKNNETTFQRRFNSNDSVSDLKNFIKFHMKTNSNIELFENLPRKVYSNDDSSLNKSGLSTYQILFFKLN